MKVRNSAVCIVALLLGACSGQHVSPPLAPETQNLSPVNALQSPALSPQSVGRYAGPTPSRMEIALYISLPGRNESELDALIEGQNTPGSSNYRRYVTPQQFGREFGADPSQYAGAIAQLRAAGFTIDALPPNLKDIEAHAPASAVASLFKSPIDMRAVEGRSFYTLRSLPQIPAALRGAEIVGLDDYHQRKPHFEHPHVVIGGAPGWGATDIENVYDLKPIYATDDGSGVTIADATEGLARSGDFNAFNKKFGLNATLVSFSAGDKSPIDNNGETTLDVEYMAAVAPKLTIDQVTAANQTDAAFDQMYSYIVNQLSSVHLVSTSWGDCEAQYGSSFGTDEALLKQAYAEGQFWLSAAGDEGVDDCANGTKGVDFPGSSPYVVSVGGTRVTPESTSGGTYTGWKDEVVWDDRHGCDSVRSCNRLGGGAGGGGASIKFGKPSFQNGLTPADGKRDVPDVSLMADDEDPNGGYFVYFEGSWQNGWGGTSFAAPEWAAFLALAQEKTGSISSPLTRLYALASGAAYRSEFHDVTSGCNTYDGVKGFCAAPNYDQGTGWGSFDGEPLWSAY